MNVELSLTIIAISVLLLAIFGIVTCIFAIQLLYTLKKTTKSAEFKITPLFDEANKIASMTSSTTERIKDNIELTTPFFQSLAKCTHFVESFPDQLKRGIHDNSMNTHFSSSKRKVDVGDWAEWLALGVVLIQNLRSK